MACGNLYNPVSPKYWNDRGIPESLRHLGDVLEVDRDCLNGDFSVHAVIARCCLDGVPENVRIANPNGLGAVFLG